MNDRRILVTGASGLVGTALGQQRDIVPLPRRDPGSGKPWWEPRAGRVHPGEGRVHGVVHLAGAGVADKRWTDDYKALIRDSRVEGSATLVSWMASLPPEQRPEVFVAASAVGLYGDRGDEELDEEAGPGEGFLAETCQAWEAELLKAQELGVRTVIVRLGVVLSRHGGALDKMLPAFRLGGGGPMGSGKQWFPWIHIDDLINIFLHGLDGPGVRGPHNAASPGIVRQGSFARALGRTLGRPAVIPAPPVALRLALGREFTNEALLASARVVPKALLDDPAFSFRYPELEPALADLLG